MDLLFPVIAMSFFIITAFVAALVFTGNYIPFILWAVFVLAYMRTLKGSLIREQTKW